LFLGFQSEYPNFSAFQPFLCNICEMG